MTDDDSAILHGEVAALQAVLISVLRKLSGERPEMVQDFCGAFDEAEAVLTGLAIKLGAAPSSVTTINALRVVEEIRAGVLEGDACH